MEWLATGLGQFNFYQAANMGLIKTRIHIFFAGLINLVIGTWPVVIPHLMYNAYGSVTDIFKSRLALSGLSLVLGIIQLFAVFKAEGSPGMIFMGLRVRDCCGNPLAFRTILMRSIPYLIGLMAFVIIPQGEGPPMLRAGVGFILVSAVIFTACSGLVAFLTGKDSIMDMLTKTKVEKAY
jgi:uncharacterized RDD family membrane protein YckC